MVTFGYTQKVVHKSILHPDISLISINANNCFEVVMETVDENEMVVEAKIDGEYNKDLLLQIKEEGRTLLVGAAFRPSFLNPNDKLSAHKVVSIALYIKIPRYKRVALRGTSCNVTASGDYQNLEVGLNDGRCLLDHVSESVSVVTQSGDIFVLGDSAEISATSKYGKVGENRIPMGSTHYELNTVTGDIYLTKTE